MNLLAFDTSTEHLSIAVQHGTQVYTHEGAAGAQASLTLIPTLLALLAQAQVVLDTLDAIVFGRGPGAFTGVRTACAVAQGLALGARAGHGVPLLPVDTLLAVAEEARLAHGCQQVMAVLDARMDEVYSAAYVWQAQQGQQGQQGLWHALSECDLCPPEALHVPQGTTVAGNAQAVYGVRLAPQARHVQARPTARALLRLAPALLAHGGGMHASAALPLYVRDKVAQTTAERAAAARTP